MKFLILTGLSGAGKTEAIRCLEDIGYFCIDNMPPTLIPKFAEACFKTDGKIDRIALVIDIRGGEFFGDIYESLLYLKEHQFDYEILFLEASDEVLVKRYKESRRKHPLSPDGRVVNGIHQERLLLKDIRHRADHVIDTSKLKQRELKDEIFKIYSEEGRIESEFAITIVSFGFKYGIPVDSDLVFDVRFLPNPFYIPELKELSGNDAGVRDYVMGHSVTQEFIAKLSDMLDFLIPSYIAEGKRQLIVSIGCTGGRHRSVAIANDLFDKLSDAGLRASIDHRDINEDIHRGGKKL
jgi:RNase adapter protein RapZ